MSLFSISFRTDSYSNEYLLAEIGVDTAENEPLEVWGENSIQYSLHSLMRSKRTQRANEQISPSCEQVNALLVLLTLRISHCTPRAFTLTLHPQRREGRRTPTAAGRAARRSARKAVAKASLCGSATPPLACPVFHHHDAIRLLETLGAQQRVSEKKRRALTSSEGGPTISAHTIISSVLARMSRASLS